MTTDEQSLSRDFWLFGYGLLLISVGAGAGIITTWNNDWVDDRVPGYVTGYVRRFWQDHRGTPKAPGRVVTLIERSFWNTLDDEQRATEGEKVWGCAYHIIPSKVDEVQEYLGIREKNGYSIQYTPFHPADANQPDIHCLVYIGMPDNSQFLGALKPIDVALKINESIGPSGENREYLLNLETSLEQLSPLSHDEHISDLARRVRAMTPPRRHVPVEKGLVEKAHELEDTDEPEEVEKSD